MLGRHTEAERSHGRQVRKLVYGCREDEPHLCVVTRVDPGQLGIVVRAPTPLQLTQVRAVADAEAVEGAQQIGLECLPQPELARSATAEEVADIDAVRPLRGGSEPEQLEGGEPLEQAPVRRGLRVVELVDHHDLERVPGEVPHVVRRQALHAREHVPPPLGPPTVDVQLAEGTVAEDLAVSAQRLLQDFLAVGHEQ